MSCKHGNWPPCDLCDDEDRMFDLGYKSGKDAAKEQLFDVETFQFLTDVITSAGLLYYGKTDKGLAQRISDGAERLRDKYHNVL